MADRQYGVLPGTIFTGTPPTYQPIKRSSERSPERLVPQAYHNDFKLDDDHTETPPPPPVHRTIVSSTRQIPEPIYRTVVLPTRQTLEPVHRTTSPTRQIPEPIHGSIVPPTRQPEAIHRTISPSRQIPEPRYSFDTTASSDISDYHPQDAGLRALQHLSGLYRPAVRTPLSGGSTAYIPHERPSYVQSRYSEQSVAPLMAHTASPGLRVPSPVRSPYRADGDDNVDLEKIVGDGEVDSPIPKSRRGMGFCSVPTINQRQTSGGYNALPDILDEKTERSVWMNEERDRARCRKRLLWIFGIIVLAAIIAAASVGGVIASRKNASRTSSSSTTASSSSSSSSSTN